MVESLRELTVEQTKDMLRRVRAAQRTAQIHTGIAKLELRDARRAQDVFDTRAGQIEEALVEKGAPPSPL